MATLPARWLLTLRAGHSGYRDVRQDLRRFRASGREALSHHDVLWCHGASIGEIKCLLPIVHGCLDDCLCQKVLISYTSPDALREIRRSLGSLLAQIVTCPLLAAGVGPLQHSLDSARVRLCVIAEQDIWPRVIITAKRMGAPLLVVDGRFKPLPKGVFGWTRRLLYSMITERCEAVCVATSKEYDAAARFVPKDRLLLTGPSKAVEAVERSSQRDQIRREYLRLFGMTQHDPILVAGNVSADEASLVAGVIARLFERFPDAGAVVAPRYTRKPRVMEAVAQPLRQAGLNYTTLSSLLASAPSDEPAHRRERVVMIDKTGYLADIYAIAQVAIVGGSFYKRGGHNFFEPVAMKVPTLCGHGAANWEGVAEQFVAADGIVRTDPEELWDAIMGVLSRPHEAGERCERAYSVLMALAESAGQNVQIAKRLLLRPGLPK